MQAIEEVIKKEKIITWWERIQQRRGKIAEIAFKNGNIEYSELLVRESDGGPCPRCKANWKKIEFDNWISEGVYYRPTCDCFYRCPNCNQELYDEQCRGLLKKNKAGNILCPDCKWPLLHGDKIYWGKQWDEWFFANRKNPKKIFELKKELGIILEVRQRD